MTIDQVRVLSSDLPVYDRAIATGDGLTVDFQTGSHPLIEDTVKVYVDGVLKTLDTDYELDLDVGLVTFAAAPALDDGIVMTFRHAILSNAQLQTLIDMEASVKLAAAQALDVMASNEALVQKKVRLLDVQTDGPAVAKALRDHANALRDQAAAELVFDDVDGAFDIAEMVFEPFGYREAIVNRVLRGG
jgi:hypothetical protein